MSLSDDDFKSILGVGASDDDVIIQSYSSIGIVPWPDDVSFQDGVAIFRDAGAGRIDFGEMGSLSLASRRKLGEEGFVSTGFSLFAPGVAGIEKPTGTVCVLGDIESVRLHARMCGNEPSACMDRCLDLCAYFDARIAEGAASAGRFPGGFASAIKTGATVCLPACEQAGMIETILRKALELGYQVKGTYGEDGLSSGSLYTVESVRSSFAEGDSGFGGPRERGDFRPTLVDSCADASAMATGVSEIASMIAAFERRVRCDLYEKRRDAVRDRIARAYAISSHAVVVQESEAASLLATLRMGIALGLLQGPSQRDIVAMWEKAGPGSRPGDDESGKAADSDRARAFRSFASAITLQSGE